MNIDRAHSASTPSLLEFSNCSGSVFPSDGFFSLFFSYLDIYKILELPFSGVSLIKDDMTSLLVALSLNVV